MKIRPIFMPRLSIITPTLCRPTLARLCESIESQTNGDWEHIVKIDVPIVFDTGARKLLDSLKHPQRKFYRCGKKHADYGNTCRWNAFDEATGDYIIYLDDDDVLAHDRVFEMLEQVTAPWAIFPIQRCGEFWFHDPPGLYKTGSGMFCYARSTGIRYPCLEHCEQHVEILEGLKKAHPHDSMHTHLYAADGLLCEELKSKYEYQAFPDWKPVLIYEKRGNGVF